MRKIFERYPWLRPVGCSVLVCALVLSVCLPLMGMRAAEPDNPILLAHPQAITVLQAGDAPGHAGSGEGADQSGSGTGGNADSTRTGEQEQPDPEETDDQSGQDTDTETVPQQQPTQPDYSEADVGTNTDSNQGDEGEQAGETGEADADLPVTPLDLGAVLTWYKYGTQASSIVCAPGQSVGKRVLLAQLDGGALQYAVTLTGLDADDAEITSVTFAEGNGLPGQIDARGAVAMELPDGTEYRNYVFTAQVRAMQKNQKGEAVETELTFTFVLRLEAGIDLDLQLDWQTLSQPGQATCGANGSVARTVKGDTIQDGLFVYSFEFSGESAADAEFLSAEYRATDGESGSLSRSGELQMAPADGQDTETYYLTVTARVSGQTLRYTFVITYEAGLDLQLQFTWYEKGVTAQGLLCDANDRANLAVKHNQVSGSELLYKLKLKGESASEAQIVSASVDGTPLNTEKGSFPLQSAEGGAVYTVLVTAEVQDKTVTFTVTIRYTSDIALEMHYFVLEDGAQKECLITCENKKTASAEPVYDDQLTDGLLSYQFRLKGEETDGVTLQSVECSQSGNNYRTETLACPDGSVTLYLRDGKTGNNTFTVTAVSGSETYTFTITVPYKHRGDNSVQIRTNLTDGMEVTNGEQVDLTVEAWSEDAQGKRTYIYANGANTTLTVKLDGKLIHYVSQSGDTQQYALFPENPETGDSTEHTLTIYAEDAYGNYKEETIRLIGKRTEKGQKIGTASIYIDAGVVGGGIMGPISYDVLSGEPISYSIAKAVWGYDAGEPFGTAKDSFYLAASLCSYGGTLDSGFYLRAIPVSVDPSTLLSGSWRDYGSNEQEVLAAIDARFGAGTALASFWRCIYRNGIELSGTSSSLGEFDYTMGSGWLYSVGGSTFYPGSAMSDYYLKDGDILTLRYTLAYGWDVGGTSDRGGSVGYCTRWLGGGWSVNHTFEKNADGQYVCRSCGLTQECPHTNTHWSDLGDGTCVEVCDDENGKQIGDPQPHEWTYTPGEGDTHTAVCTRCGHEESLPHTWQDVPDSNTATCTQPGEKTVRCADCGAEKTIPSEALGHEVNEWLMDGVHTHYQLCHRCGERVNEGQHTYTGDGEYYQCTVCGGWHDVICGGTLTAADSGDGATHIWTCSTCGLIHAAAPHQLDANGVCTVCGYTAAPAHDCTTQGHVYENGFCIYCGAPQPVDPPVGPTEPTDPTKETEDEENSGNE